MDRPTEISVVEIWLFSTLESRNRWTDRQRYLLQSYCCYVPQILPSSGVEVGMLCSLEARNRQRESSVIEVWLLYTSESRNRRTVRVICCRRMVIMDFKTHRQTGISLSLSLSLPLPLSLSLSLSLSLW